MMMAKVQVPRCSSIEVRRGRFTPDRFDGLFRHGHMEEGVSRSPRWTDRSLRYTVGNASPVTTPRLGRRKARDCTHRTSTSSARAVADEGSSRAR